MHAELINYCLQFVKLSRKEKELMKTFFRPLRLKRKQMLLEEGKTWDFVAFVTTGVIRHYHVKDGDEITCDITLPPNFITDFKSFTQDVPSTYFFQALKDSELLKISRQDLYHLYANSTTIETLGRLMAEQVAQRATEMAMSLASDKPEERVDKLVVQRKDLFQEVPQRYLAHLLGISPESLSRIRARKSKKS